MPIGKITIKNEVEITPESDRYMFSVIENKLHTISKNQQIIERKLNFLLKVATEKNR